MKNVRATLLILAPLLFLVPTAHASIPTPSSGTFTTTVTSVVPILTADGNSGFSLSGNIVLTGTFVGSGPIAFTVLVHPTGEDNLAGHFTCFCTVAGNSGSIVVGFAGTGTFAVGGPVGGQYVILSGTDGLANLNGQGPFGGFQTSFGFEGPYSGQTNFSP